MKSSAQALGRIAGVTVVALVAVSRWATSRRFETEISASVGSAQRSITQRAATQSATQAVKRPPALSPEKIDALRARVRPLLVRWREIKTGDTETQAQLTAEFVALLTDDNAAAIARSLSAEELDTPLGLAALARWLDGDAMAATTWIAGRAEATETQALLVARVFPNERARLGEFCDGLPDTPWKQTLLSAAGLERVSGDPVGAIEIALRMMPGDAQTNVLQTAAYDWMTRDPLAASAWLATVNDAAVREQLLAVGTKALASTDPDLATGWLAEINSDGVRHDTALCLVEGWVARDPAAAASWVARISASGLRESAVELVARNWLQADAGAATAWLEKLPERDTVLARLEAERVGVDDPAELE